MIVLICVEVEQEFEELVFDHHITSLVTSKKYDFRLTEFRLQVSVDR